MTDHDIAAVLRCLADVLEEARGASSTGRPSVIPVLVEELAALRPVLGEIFRAEGCYLATATDFVDGLALQQGARPDAQLVELITRVRGIGVTDPVAVQVEGERLTVRLGDRPAPANPGDRDQIGMLTALLDPAMQHQRLAVVVYDETQMAAPALERTWATLIEAPSAGSSTSPRTLVALIGVANTDYARHYPRGEGARWIIRPGDVAWRHPWERDRSAVARLVEGQDLLVLMTGAGFSASSRLPTGDELRDQALGRMFPDLAADLPSSTDLAARFYREVRSSRLLPQEVGVDPLALAEELTLERVLREEAQGTPTDDLPPTLRGFAAAQQARASAPGAAVRHLRSLLNLRRRLVLLTVNFDLLVESGARVLRGDEPEGPPPAPSDPPTVRLFVTDQELRSFPAYLESYRRHGGAVPYVKLHGSVDEPSTVRATVEATKAGLQISAAECLNALSGSMAVPTRWVYVGCSMRDPDISDVISLPGFADGVDEMWVAPTLDRHVRAFIDNRREPQWRLNGRRMTYSERTVTLTADAFTEELAHRLDRL